MTEPFCKTCRDRGIVIGLGWTFCNCPKGEQMRRDMAWCPDDPPTKSVDGQLPLFPSISTGLEGEGDG